MKRRGLDYFKANWSWSGWETLDNIYHSTDDIDTMKIIVSSFKLGSRAEETPTVKRSNFDFNSEPDYIVVKNMLVEKQRKKVVATDEKGSPLLNEYGKKQYVYLSKPDYRTFKFPKKEKYSKLLTYMVKYKTNDKGEEVEAEADYVPFPYTQKQQYYKLSCIGIKERMAEAEAEAEAKGEEFTYSNKENWNRFKSDYHPHLFRSLRACQLIRDYSIYRSLPVLAHWFGWKDLSEPNEYLSLNTTDEEISDAELSKLKWGEQ